MTPRTTLIPTAPWPTTAELEAAIAAAHVRAALQQKIKNKRNPPRKYQEVKP